MKKSLLMLAALATVTSSFAFGLPQMKTNRMANPLKRTPLRTAVEKKGRQMSQQPTLFRAADANGELSMNWGYCEGTYMAIPMAAGEFKGAIMLTADQATEWAGATITSISVGNPVDITTMSPNYETMTYEYKNPIKEATVWLSYGLDEEPFVSTKGELTEEGLQWSTIALPSAYTIEAGKKLYIGYTMDVPDDENIYPLITDYSYYPDANGCYLYSTFEGFDNEGYLLFGKDYKWSTPGADFGNLSIRACVNGDMLPTNIAENYAWFLPQYAVPGEDFVAATMIQNKAANDITSIEYTFVVGDMEPQTAKVEFDAPLGYFDVSNEIDMEFKCTTVGNNIPYKLYISAINDEKVDFSDDAIEGVLLCIAEGYPRNVVVEEATGTWCGWCVIGYAGMEYMANNYAGEGYIGIAVHAEDEMDVMGRGMAYELWGMAVDGFPSAYINRDMSNDVYPEPSELEYAFADMKDIPAYASISATLEKGDDPTKLKLSTKSVFDGSEENAAYAVGYTVIENHVGPYVQSNYTSGMDGDYYGFESKPEKVPLMYDEVARNCSEPMGIEGSLPAAVTKGEEYAYDTEIVLGKEVDPTKVRVVAMVINLNNGVIENACEVEAPGYNGVEQISSASKALAFAYGSKGEIRFRVNGASAQVFSIDGRRVAANVKDGSVKVPAGVYVVSMGGKAMKVVVR